MSLPGMKSTADFGTDVRPKNYREGIMLLEPRSGASLYRLTSAMKDSKMVDDPEFKWYEEAVELYNYATGAAALVGDTTITLAAGSTATRLKPGDNLRNARTFEVIQVISIVSNTSITVARAFGPAGTSAGTAAAMNLADKLLYIGSAYREGAPRPAGTSFGGDWVRNFTQIFRTPVEWTRTATKTRTRTGDEMKNDRRRALNKHTLGIERAAWLGTAMETMEAGQPKRTTGGWLNFLPANRRYAVTDGAGLLDLDELEDIFKLAFTFGSSEKLVYSSLAGIMAINQAIRKNSQYHWMTGEKMFGLNVTRLVTPAGVLVLTEHPAFGQAGDFLAESLAIIDTENIGYRYITDTTLLKDRQANGDDGVAEEYLTEAGFVVAHPNTHLFVSNLKGGKVDG